MELIVHRVRVVSVMMAIVVAVALLSPSFIITTNAYDPSPLQNICVADNNASAVHVNGKVCKDPKLVTVEDFVFSGLQIAADTNNRLGFGTNIVNVDKLPGLNTLGISLLRADIAPNGVSVPHLHPRAAEILIILEGSVDVGFVDSTPGTKSRLFSKTLKPGDVFAFPIGTIQFAKNVGNTTVSAIAVFNSQDFGFIRVPSDVFGTNPPIPADLLAKAFQLDENDVKHLQSLAW